MGKQTKKDEPRRFLFVEFGNGRPLLSCLDGPELRERTQNPTNNYRVSPIFPVIPKEGKLPIERNFFIGFFVFEDAYLIIGKLIADLPKTLQKNLWFSHGLASIILFSSDRSTFAKVRKIGAEKFRSLEIWQIKERVIYPQPPNMAKPAPINSAVCKMHPVEKLDAETRTLVNELRHCLNTAVARAAQFLPSSLKTFERLYPAVNDVISELVNLQSPRGDNLICVSATGEYTESALALQKRKQQLTDQLIQINAALSYVISQAYSGIAPILQHECQIRKYSLLGVGSAHNGMAAFTEFCELTFQRFPVDEAIKQEFRKAPAFTHEILGKETPKDWDDARFNVDTYIKDVRAQESKLNLAYFSGRLGFRETQFSITAPLQTLTDAASARWSLMTLTHELMHAHVRAILGALFSLPNGSAQGKSFQQVYENFVQRAKQEDSKPDSLLETIQFLLFDYCEKKPRVETGISKIANTPSGGAKITEEVKSVEATSFNVLLQSYHREINEILVHVLDFNYFYDCREEPYLALLWTSWAPFAPVSDNVDEYILRSLLAISPKTSGDNNSRFVQASDKLKSVLALLRKRNSAEPLFEHALARLEHPIYRKQLVGKFALAVYLVDMAHKAFVCKHIHAGLYTDSNVVKHDLEYVHVLETGRFDPLAIESPVALVSDLLRRELEEETLNLPSDYVSAWLFLVLASAPTERIEYVSR